jgi:hypothetical protein
MRHTEIRARTFGFKSMTLRELVEKYLAIAGGFSFLAPLADFGMEGKEIESILGAFDEDYHISRYIHFIQVSGPAYTINGFEQTHVSMDEEIQSIL